MKRIEQEVKQAVVISREDFLTDYKQGYCVLEFNPARTEELRDPRSSRTLKREHAADLMLRCMDCQFDTLAGVVTRSEEGNQVTGEYLMREHRFRGEHKWPYSPFSNPYGFTCDVMIEGIEEYQPAIEAMKEKEPA